MNQSLIYFFGLDTVVEDWLACFIIPLILECSLWLSSGCTLFRRLAHRWCCVSKCIYQQIFLWFRHHTWSLLFFAEVHWPVLKKSKASCSPWAEGCIWSVGQWTSSMEGTYESMAVHGVPLFQPPPHSFSSFSAQQSLLSQPSTRIEPMGCVCLWMCVSGIHT